MLASAPYKSTKDLVEDLQLATVKRLMPNVDRLSDDEALANAVLDVREVYEDTVYQVAHDVIAVLKAYAEVDKATGGKLICRCFRCCSRFATISPRSSTPDSSGALPRMR